eukprot:jgi/Tetstr1/466390/TSEL_010919.t1
MTLRELKAHLPDLTWDKVNQKTSDVMTSVRRSIPALNQSLDADFHQLKDIAVLRLSHEDRLDEIAAEEHRRRQLVEDGSTAAALKNRRVDVISFTAPTTESVPTSSARPCASTTPLVAVAAVEAAKAQAEVSVVVMAVDAAMEAHPERTRTGLERWQRGWTMDVETGLSEIEMDLARKAGQMLTGQHDARADGAATSSTMADMEAMLSRILEKSQAAH